MKIKTMVLAVTCFSAVFAMDDYQNMQTIVKPKLNLKQPSSLQGKAEVNRTVMNCCVTYDYKTGAYGGTSTAEEGGDAHTLNPAIAEAVYRVLLADLQHSKK